MVESLEGAQRVTVAADKGYDTGLRPGDARDEDHSACSAE
jgi:hypothetical protein